MVEYEAIGEEVQGAKKRGTKKGLKLHN